MRRRYYLELLRRRRGERKEFLHLNTQQLRMLAYPPRKVKKPHQWMR